MATKKTKTNKNSKDKTKRSRFKLSNQQKLIFGSFLIILGILLLIAFVSFFFTGNADQSTIDNFTSRETKADNWLNKLGAWLSHFFILKGFGVSSFIFSGLIFLSGLYVLLDSSLAKLRKHWFWGLITILWFSVLLGFFNHVNDALGGTVGFEINTFLQDYIGKIGTVFLLLFILIVFFAVRYKLTAQSIITVFKKAKGNLKDDFTKSENNEDYTVALENNLSLEAEAIKSVLDIKEEGKKIVQKEKSKPNPDLNIEINNDSAEEDIEMVVEKVAEELSETDNLANKLVEDFGLFDPTLELGNYQFPHLDLLKKYNSEGITINQEELEENKNKIVETLNNYSI